MQALIELPRARRQEPREAPRRWFSCEEADLIVMHNDRGVPYGFHLCYAVNGTERALTWEVERGFSHRLVEEGATSRRYGRAPILAQEVPLDLPAVRRLFDAIAQELPANVRALVAMSLGAYPANPPFRPSRPLDVPRFWNR